MNNIKRFGEFKTSLNENLEDNIESNGNDNTSAKEVTGRIMNALYGMDDKYETDVAASYNEADKSVKLVLDSEEEIAKIMMYLTQNDYNATENGLEILISL